MRMFRILSACGTGVATSTVAAETCKRLLEERGISKVEITECKAMEIVGLADNLHPDCIIHTAEIPVSQLTEYKIFRCLEFITGFGAEEVADQIADYLKSLE
ncbi:MAG: PTS sugar transporter subunit IIB [Anaerostipes sp.]|uniref:PTS sugar transporter subunit IIB n=1 Tax=Anaerostipes sp. TaxID=1872530 RepID=UPI0039959A7B